ncbi:MAG: hypothetical protein ACJ8FY_10370 [Gemmataceae bacterium]
MLRLIGNIGTIASGLILAWAPLGLLAAPAGEPKAKPESAAEKVRKALDQTIDITPEGVGSTLDSATAFFQEATKANFTVDRGTLAQMGLDPNSMQLSVKKQNTKARTALRAILQPQGLSYAILGDTVLITSDDMALNRQLKQRINVDLDRVPLETALKDLAKETVSNLLIDKKIAKEAKAEVSLQFEDIPYETVVRLLCEQAGLKPVRLGNVLYITSNAVAKELRAEPDLAPSGIPGMPSGLEMNGPPAPAVPAIGLVPGRAGAPVVGSPDDPAPGDALPASLDKKPAEKKPEEGEKNKPEKQKK